MQGEMAEWSKARAWKVRIPVKGYRGFESLSLREPMTAPDRAPIAHGPSEQNQKPIHIR